MGLKVLQHVNNVAYRLIHMIQDQDRRSQKVIWEVVSSFDG